MKPVKKNFSIHLIHFLIESSIKLFRQMYIVVINYFNLMNKCFLCFFNNKCGSAEKILNNNTIRQSHAHKKLIKFM